VKVVRLLDSASGSALVQDIAPQPQPGQGELPIRAQSRRFFIVEPSQKQLTTIADLLHAG
jgi:hypothetical protein